MANDYWNAGVAIEQRDAEIAALKARLAEAERTLADANGRGDMLQFRLAEAERWIATARQQSKDGGFWVDQLLLAARATNSGD